MPIGKTGSCLSSDLVLRAASRSLSNTEEVRSAKAVTDGVDCAISLGRDLATGALSFVGTSKAGFASLPTLRKFRKLTRRAILNDLWICEIAPVQFPRLRLCYGSSGARDDAVFLA
ncbi:hypothetical protein RM533_13445, partial [Croceicoccus sp. F390]